jgi:hypothetical protein
VACPSYEWPWPSLAAAPQMHSRPAPAASAITHNIKGFCRTPNNSIHSKMFRVNVEIFGYVSYVS